jgi:DNA-binding MarR family transcriptional regulator
VEIEQSIPAQVSKTVKLIENYLEDQLAKADIPLTRLQFAFLMIISKNDGEPQCALAELTGRDKTTYTRNIKTLESKSLVIRRPSLTDKRVNLVHITTKGTELLERAKPIVQEVIKNVESDFSNLEKDRLIASLEKIRNRLTNI